MHRLAANRRSLGVAMLTAIALAGCSPTVHWPNLFHPGPAEYQRAIAEQWDPYVLNDVAPEVVGGRPLGYMQPVPEVERSRLFQPALQTQSPTTPVLVQPMPPSYPPPPASFTQPAPLLPVPSPQPPATQPYTPPPFRY